MKSAICICVVSFVLLYSILTKNVNGCVPHASGVEFQKNLEIFVKLSEMQSLDESSTNELLAFFGSSTSRYQQELMLPVGFLPRVLCTGDCSQVAIESWIMAMVRKFNSDEFHFNDEFPKKHLSELLAVALDQNQDRGLRIAIILYLDRNDSAEKYDCEILLLLLSNQSITQLAKINRSSNAPDLASFRVHLLNRNDLKWIGKLDELNCVLLQKGSTFLQIKNEVDSLRSLPIVIPFRLADVQAKNEYFEKEYGRFSSLSFPQYIRGSCFSFFLHEIRSRFEALPEKELAPLYKDFLPVCDYMLSLSLCCDNLEQFLSARALAFDWHRYARPKDENCPTIQYPGMIDIEKILAKNRGRLESANAFSLLKKLIAFAEVFRAYASKVSFADR